jgi:cell division protein FtsL
MKGKLLTSGSILLAGMMISAAAVPKAAAQDRQLAAQQQSRSSERNEGPDPNWSWSNVRDETTEGWLITKPRGAGFPGQSRFG